MKIGKYNDSSEIYHSEPHIGSSSLKQMLLSPGHFLEAWKGPKKESKAFDEGNAVHSVLLEQNLDGFLRRPDGIDARTKEGKEKLKELEATGKIILSGEIFDSLERRLSEFVKSNSAMSKYNNAEIEQSFYVKDPETGLFVKARPDIFKPGMISDLKTTANMATFEKQVFNLGYHIQCGLYCLVSELVTGSEILIYSFIVQEKTAPYGVKVFNFDQATINFCKQKARELLNRASICISENNFPLYDDVEKNIQIPNWVLSNELTIFDEVI